MRMKFNVLILLLLSLFLSSEESLDGLNFGNPLHNPKTTSGIGERSSLKLPYGGIIEYGFHKGLDMIPEDKNETGIYASESGIISECWSRGDGHPIYGRMIIIDHGNGVYTLYGHLSYALIPEKRYVKKGDLIGIIGSTGQSTGVHLHFEIITDPAIFLGYKEKDEVKKFYRVSFPEISYFYPWDTTQRNWNLLLNYTKALEEK